MIALVTTCTSYGNSVTRLRFCCEPWAAISSGLCCPSKGWRSREGRVERRERRSQMEDGRERGKQASNNAHCPAACKVFKFQQHKEAVTALYATSFLADACSPRRSVGRSMWPRPPTGALCPADSRLPGCSGRGHSVQILFRRCERRMNSFKIKTERRKATMTTLFALLLLSCVPRPKTQDGCPIPQDIRVGPYIC